MEPRESNFVEIYTSPDGQSAHLAQLYLENEGIMTTLEGEINNQVLTGYQGQTWVTLYAPAPDAERARQLLYSSGFLRAPATGEAPLSEEVKDETDDKGKKITLIIFLILIVLGLLALYTYLVQ